MKVTDILRRVIRIADNDSTIQISDVQDWINDCIARINQSCGASFPLVPVPDTNPSATPAFDPNFHEILVVFCVMKYREGDSDYTASQYFAKEFNDLLHSMQRDLIVQPAYRAGYTCYQTTVPAGIQEVDTLTITNGATASGNVTITLNGVAFNVAVLNGDNAGAVATKINNATYAGWTTSLNSTVITFTNNTVGVCSAPTLGVASTGVVGTFQVTTAGASPNLSGLFDLSALPVGAFFNPITVYHNNVDITKYSELVAPPVTPTMQYNQLIISNPYMKPQVQIDITQVTLNVGDTITVDYEENAELENPPLYWWENTGW